MKNFVLEPSMLTMGGVFYPTGHVFAMLPSRADAEQAAQALIDGGIPGDEMSLLTPEVIQEKITRTVGTADIPLPSAGTEADTVRRYAELAGKGHYALLIHAPKAADSDRVMDLLKDRHVSYAQKYRMLVIEDLA